MNMNIKSINKNGGFTLVEIMVVVSIIAILAGMFLIGLKGYRSSAYDARRLSDLQQTQGYIELYYNKNGSYPNATKWTGTDSLEAALTDSIKGIGVSRIPQDPQYSASSPSHTYKYGVDNSTDPQSYMLETTLSDPNDHIFSQYVVPTPYSGITSCTKPNYCIKS